VQQEQKLAVTLAGDARLKAAFVASLVFFF